jgi:hypothetical protein
MKSPDDVIAEMLAPHSSTYVPEYVASLHQNVGRSPLINRVDAWKNELTAAEVRAFEQVAGDILVKKGYELMYARRPWDPAYSSFVHIQQHFSRTIGVHRWRKARRKKCG